MKKDEYCLATRLFCDGMPIAEIARLMNKPAQTVADNLRAILEKRDLSSVSSEHRARIVQFLVNAGFSYRAIKEQTGLNIASVCKYNKAIAHGFPTILVNIKEDIKDYMGREVSSGKYDLTIVNNLYAIAPVAWGHTLIHRSEIPPEVCVVIGTSLTADQYTKRKLVNDEAVTL